MKGPSDSRRKVLVFSSPEEMADFMVGQWKEIAGEAMREKGYFTAALSGGKTPAGFYRKLSLLREAFPWNRTHIFLADERFVPFTNCESNYGMLIETFLRTVNIPAGNCHPVPVEEPSHESSAKRYEDELVRFFRLSAGEVPAFDLVILGVGDDGHTASLFPGDPAVTAAKRLAAPAKSGGARHDRITLTLPVINNARKVIFLVSGEDKAAVLKKVIDGDKALPAALVCPERGDVLFVVDRAAAFLLPALRNRISFLRLCYKVKT